MAVGFNPSFITLIAGALVMGTYLSLHFGKVRRDKSQMHAILAAGLVLAFASPLPSPAQAQTLEEQDFEQEGLAGFACSRLACRRAAHFNAAYVETPDLETLPHLAP